MGERDFSHIAVQCTAIATHWISYEKKWLSTYNYYAVYLILVYNGEDTCEY